MHAKGGRSRFTRPTIYAALGMMAIALAGCPPDQTPPGTVTGFTATPGDGQVALAWTNPTDSDLAGVKILRKAASAPTSETDGDVVYDGLNTVYTDETAVNGTEYYYAAFTYDTTGNYSGGVAVSATPEGDTTAPGPVTGFTATPGDSQVALAWTNPTDADLAGIRIVRKTGSAPESATDGDLVYDGTDTTYVDGAVTNGTGYFYAAFAYDTAGNYSTAAHASATPSVGDTTPPAPVTGFTATAGNAQVALAWTNPADSDFAGVLVIRKTGSAPASTSDGDTVYNGTDTTYTDTTAANGTEYFYAAFAYDTSSNYAEAAQASATPTDDETPPAAVTDFTATPGDAQVDLAWTNPGDADLAGVQIVRQTGAAPTDPADGNLLYDGLDETYTDATAVNGTEYFYAAYAYDSAGNVAEAAQASATPTAATAQEEVLEALVELVEFVELDPEGVLTPEQEETLLEVLTEADGLYRGDDPCGAAEVLEEAYLGKAQEYRAGEAVGTAEELYNLGRMLRYNMLGTLLVKADCPGAERVGMEADAEVEEESPDELTAAGEFGEPKVLTLVEEDEEKGTREVFTQVRIPGAESVLGAVGAPNVPVFRRLIAVPRGAEVQTLLTKAEPEVAEEIYMNLYPAQEEPIDAVPDPSIFENAAFYKDPEMYATDDPYPPEPVSLTHLGDARDLEYYLVEVATGQYRALSGKLTLFKKVNFEVDFQGGSGAFMTDAMLNPFESSTPVFTQAVMNRGVLEKFIEGRIRPVLSGEEFMILTHPDFYDAAITLRDWKRDKGIWTNVYTCGTGSGVTDRETKEEIDAYIHDHYNSVFIRPSYILLLGDAEFIEPYYQNSIGTDWPYAILGSVGSDTIPDFAVGRIPVDTLEQANTVVDKIIEYEDSPPENTSFYAMATLVSQFQCCRTGAATGTDQRTFIEVSEFARNVMVSAGKTVDRIYTETGGPTTPVRYYDGTFLPTDIGWASGFAWDGDAADITSAWNDGRFLIMHRDHGWQQGWSHPDYELPEIDDLTNADELPVVFSVNCASGFWDNETAGGAYGTTYSGVYFCEKLLRKADGGAVGILGDTRNSPSWANSTLTQGFFDAIWPSAIGWFGGAASQRRLGDILNHGKIYLMSQVGMTVMGEPISSSSATNELYLWHCIGDPTLEIWTGYPYLLLLPVELLYRYVGLFQENDVVIAEGLNLEYAQDGAEITVYQLDLRKQRTPIGRGIVEDGVANIRFNEEHNTSLELEFVANYENAAAKILTAKKMK